MCHLRPELRASEASTKSGQLQDGSLVLEHYRHGTIPLTQLWKDDFGGSAWFTRSVDSSATHRERSSHFLS